MLDHEFRTEYKVRHVLDYRQKFLDPCSENILNKTSQFSNHVVKIVKIDYKREFTLLESYS
jgi:hypothetical protein